MKQTIKPVNCAPARRLKPRNEFILYLQSVKQTDGSWFTSLGILLYTKLIIPALMGIKPDSNTLTTNDYAMTALVKSKLVSRIKVTSFDPTDSNKRIHSRNFGTKTWFQKRD